jgi:hypothetical protein
LADTGQCLGALGHGPRASGWAGVVSQPALSSAPEMSPAAAPERIAIWSIDLIIEKWCVLGGGEREGK